MVRAATADDMAAVAEIWGDGWGDGHLGHVPEELVAIRTRESFVERAPARVADTTVAVANGEIAGFVMVVGDEVEQVYVSKNHRGTGIAATLLTAAERVVSENGHESAWLAVVAGNARARRFYERQGWADDGPFEYPASGGILVPCHRYVKKV